MYADDLAHSAKDLQEMLDFAIKYAAKWRYSFNASKSVIFVLGESRSLGNTTINNDPEADSIQEAEEQHHLGILRSVFITSVHNTNECYSACRAAFYTLNAVIGFLHPVTSFNKVSVYQ